MSAAEARAPATERGLWPPSLVFRHGVTASTALPYRQEKQANAAAARTEAAAALTSLSGRMIHTDATSLALRLSLRGAHGPLVSAPRRHNDTEGGCPHEFRSGDRCWTTGRFVL